jgi:gluconolactonase
MKIFASELGFPEAPVLLPDGDFLFVEMTPETGCITRISKDGQTREMVARTGRPNGLAQDRNGMIWIAETAQRALLKMTLDGDCEVFADNCDGEEFLFLNDLAFAPNGDLYLTDSGIAIDEFAPGGELNPDWENLDYDGRVYRIDVNTADVSRIDRGLRFTNGIAFGPDENLYIAETLTGSIHRYEWENGKVVGGREFFGSVLDPDNQDPLRGPDGMKFGEDGNLYACVFGQGDVTVLDENGAVVRRLKTEGSCPTNLAFGHRGDQSIYVTEAISGTVQVFEVGTEGFTLHG